MSERSDIESGLEEQRERKERPSERYLVARFAIQVAKQLERERTRQGLSYEQLAGRAGTSKSHVIRLLSGTYAGISNRSLAKLCRALRCEIDVTIEPVAVKRAGAATVNARATHAAAHRPAVAAAALAPRRHGSAL